MRSTIRDWPVVRLLGTVLHTVVQYTYSTAHTQTFYSTVQYSTLSTSSATPHYTTQYAAVPFMHQSLPVGGQLPEGSGS